MQSYDLVAHLLRQRAFSRATFGPGPRAKGVVDHIRKELIEIESDPRDITEWIDVILLALDGAWRCAEANDAPIEIIVATLAAKQSKNERRNWPDWRMADPDKAIEHVITPAGAASSSWAERIALTLTEPPRDGCPYSVCQSPAACRGACRLVVQPPAAPTIPVRA